METLIVIAVVLVAAVFMIRKFWLTAKGKGGCSCCRERKNCPSKNLFGCNSE